MNTQYKLFVPSVYTLCTIAIIWTTFFGGNQHTLNASTLYLRNTFFVERIRNAMSIVVTQY